MKHVKLYEQFKSAVPGITTKGIRSMSSEDFLEYMESLLDVKRYEEMISATKIWTGSEAYKKDLVENVEKIMAIRIVLKKAWENADPYHLRGANDTNKRREWDNMMADAVDSYMSNKSSEYKEILEKIKKLGILFERALSESVDKTSGEGKLNEYGMPKINPRLVGYSISRYAADIDKLNDRLYELADGEYDELSKFRYEADR